MQKNSIFILIFFSLFLSLSCQELIPDNPDIKGHLLIIGGGKRPESVMRRFIELADGFDHGKILVLPMASSDPPDVGEFQANQIKQFGAKNVSFLIVSREEAMQDSTLSKLRGVTGIFFSGGAQTRLMKAIRETPFAKKIFQLYKDGAVIGGTSAGAAAMSKIMITGDEKWSNKRKDRAFSRIEAANIITEEGLGFLKNVIIDQHFIRRKRHNRLISLILEHPDQVGVGIDESTAIIVYPDQTFEVIGENSVIFYDARKARVAMIDTTRTYNLAAYNIKVHVLTQGYQINLLTNKITAPVYE